MDGASAVWLDCGEELRLAKCRPRHHVEAHTGQTAPRENG